MLRTSTWLWLVAGFLLVQSAQAQEEKRHIVSFEGTEIFCHVLHSLGLQPIRHIDAEELDPNKTLIVMFGHDQGSLEIHEATGGLARYRTDGGSLLYASDSWLERPELGVRILGVQVMQPHDAYRGNLLCPLLAQQDKNGLLEPEHPLFRFLAKGIATNRPSWLTLDQGRTPLQPLLDFPSSLREGRDPVPKTYMAGSGKNAAPQGRALVIAGQGMFMNGMMLQPDNDNFAFTVNAIEWLREGAQGRKRTRALFIVDGKIITEFNVKLTTPVPPVPLPTVTMVNHLLRGLEDERMFHRMLASLLDLNRSVAVLLALGTFGLLLYAVKKFMEGRAQLETSVPLLFGVASGNLQPTAVESQRQQELWQGHHLWEIARPLADEWLRENFGVASQQGAEKPSWDLRLQGNDSRLQMQVDLLLRLVRSQAPFRVNRREFLGLMQALPSLHQAIMEGRLTLLVEGKEVRQR